MCRDAFYPTCRWMKTTDPRSLQVPPWRSTCSMRRIWRKRIPLQHTTPAHPSVIIYDFSNYVSGEKNRRKWLFYLMADVAKTWPLEPTPSTMIEAMTTIKSAGRDKGHK